MDYSIRKKWLIAFWVNWTLPIIIALTTLNLFGILLTSLLMGVTYYCAYKKYGTWWLTFQLTLLYISLGILGLAFLLSLVSAENQYLLKDLFLTPLDLILIGLNIYYYIWSYRLRAFNRLYRQKLFTGQI